MTYVYLLQSVPKPLQTYIGVTSDLRARMTRLNGGQSPHTAKHLPWQLVTYIAFSNRE